MQHSTESVFYFKIECIVLYSVSKLYMASWKKELTQIRVVVNYEFTIKYII